MGPDRVAGIVLAAGLSSRMGGNKMLIELAGETVVRRAVRTTVEAGLRPAHLVVGHEAERVQRAVDGLDVSTLMNPDPSRGLYTSVQLAFAHVGHEVDVAAAVLILADMPLVSAEMLRTLVATWRAAPGAPLVISLFGGIVAPPILYARSVFGELAALDSETAGKALVQRHRSRALEVSWPERDLSDLDEPSDLDRVRDFVEGKSRAGSGTRQV